MTLDGSNKDSIIGAVSHWIVEVGELDGAFKRDIARLKGFLTADYDKLRRPYDRCDSEYPRRTVFAATVNEAAFLVDTTGNSRWWTIAVDDLKFNHDIDMQQLFAQIAAEIDANEPWWLDPDEEALLNAWNDRHATPSVVAEAVQDRLDLDIGSSIPLRPMMPSELLRACGIKNPTNQQAKECGALLRKLIGPPNKIQGNWKWKVRVHEDDIDHYHPPQPAKPIVRTMPGDKF